MRFRLAAVAAALAVLVHGAALTIPAINDALYTPAYPWLRHVVFMGINGTLAYLLPRPPEWLV